VWFFLFVQKNKYNFFEYKQKNITTKMRSEMNRTKLKE
jgi:hypothetical protein